MKADGVRFLAAWLRKAVEELAGDADAEDGDAREEGDAGMTVDIVDSVALLDRGGFGLGSGVADSDSCSADVAAAVGMDHSGRVAGYGNRCKRNQRGRNQQQAVSRCLMEMIGFAACDSAEVVAEELRPAQVSVAGLHSNIVARPLAADRIAVAADVEGAVEVVLPVVALGSTVVGSVAPGPAVVAVVTSSRPGAGADDYDAGLGDCS